MDGTERVVEERGNKHTLSQLAKKNSRVEGGWREQGEASTSYLEFRIYSCTQKTALILLSFPDF